MKYRPDALVLLFVLVLSLIPLLVLLQSGLPITHDGQDHVARIANFYQSMQDGNIIPRWAGNLNWGFGHPILMFLYPLPSYAASLFVLLGFSFVDSVKLVFGLAFVASALSMYVFVRTFARVEAAVVASILYAFAPYRFVDLYVRGAIGEHIAFVFPPLVLLSIYHLSKKYSYSYLLLGSVSIAGLILSHNAVSLMFLPVILGYGLYLLTLREKKKAFIKVSSIVFLSGFLLSAFFWIPAFLEGKYTLRDIVTSGEYVNRFVTWQQLLYGVWNYGGSGQFSVQIGIMHWLAIIGLIPVSYLTYKKKKIEGIFLFSILVLFFAVLFVMTESSLFLWERVTLLQKFQFPWRFLSVSVFLSAVAGAFVTGFLPRSLKVPVAICFVIGSLFVTKDYWRPQGFQEKSEIFYTGIYNSTTDTGESAPIWSVRFMEKQPKSKIEIIEGDGTAIEKKRNSTKHSYHISAETEVRVLENTLYFPGWEVRVDGAQVPIQFQDPNHRGLMTFQVPRGEHDVTLVFRETRLRLLSDMMSIGGLFGLIILRILNTPWKRFLSY